MDLSSVTRFRLRRVNPFRGLVVDESTWADAHDYHRDHQRLHALAFHSPGVAAGLEVSVAKQAGSLIVGPGVALDFDGNVIVVGQERRVPLENVSGGDVFVLLSYQETRVNSDANAPRGSTPNRIVESYKIDVADKLPEPPAIEVGRVRWSGPGAQLREAADPADPQPDEIDLRFRHQARVARPVPVNVGFAATEGASSHLAGVANLLREIDNVAGYKAVFRGPVHIEEGAGSCDLLYIRNSITTEPAATTIASHLERGGSVFADNCRVQSDEAFSSSILALCARLGFKLGPVDTANPLLNARYPFAEPPPGAADGEVNASGRFVFSMRDYGCAWAGACGKSLVPRETIRGALEWGVNVAIASVQPPPRP